MKQIRTDKEIFKEQFEKLTKMEKHDLFRSLVGCFMREYDADPTEGASILYGSLSEEWQRATHGYMEQTISQHGKAGKVINLADVAEDIRSRV